VKDYAPRRADALNQRLCPPLVNGRRPSRCSPRVVAITMADFAKLEPHMCDREYFSRRRELVIEHAPTALGDFRTKSLKIRRPRRGGSRGGIDRTIADSDVGRGVDSSDMPAERPRRQYTGGVNCQDPLPASPARSNPRPQSCRSRSSSRRRTASLRSHQSRRSGRHA